MKEHRLPEGTPIHVWDEISNGYESGYQYVRDGNFKSKLAMASDCMVKLTTRDGKLRVRNVKEYEIFELLPDRPDISRLDKMLKEDGAYYILTYPRGDYIKTFDVNLDFLKGSNDDDCVPLFKSDS
tara:strand:+ start:503 stop:880 length:378 start_codon:yes stop_codon:yes gene_type:complete